MFNLFNLTRKKTPRFVMFAWDIPPLTRKKTPRFVVFAWDISLMVATA